MAWVEQHGDTFRVRYRLGDGSLFTEPGFPDITAAEDRAADVESDQRRGRFVDPRLERTTIDEWIRTWLEVRFVAPATRATYDSHIRNHILPHWSGTALGDIQRMAVKGWVNKKLRTNLSERSSQDILVLFSMILGEAVDEELIGANPCRKLRINFIERPERPHATTDEVDTIAARMTPDAGLMVVTAAYTGLRWGELAGLQWTNTYLDDNPRIVVDPDIGALHEIKGRLELGPPKTPASARTVHLPPFLADLLTAHRDSRAQFVFTSTDGAMHRRSNFRRRAWLPALAANPERNRPALNEKMHFHDLRHTHETWLVEDNIPRVLRLQRLGHKRKDIDDFYSHITDPMRAALLDALQRRWELRKAASTAVDLDAVTLGDLTSSGSTTVRKGLLPPCSHGGQPAGQQDRSPAA